jgi:hypothetical protein
MNPVLTEQLLTHRIRSDPPFGYTLNYRLESQEPELQNEGDGQEDYFSTLAFRPKHQEPQPHAEDAPVDLHGEI